MKKIIVFLLAVLITLSACTPAANSLNSSSQSALSATENIEKDLSLNFSFGSRAGHYKGESLDGLPNGEGTFEAKEGDTTFWTYEGMWKNGHFEGQGKTSWPSGQFLEGKYENDEMNGQGALYFPDNRLAFYGKFVDGVPDKQDLIDQCSSYDYDDIMKNPNEYYGKLALFKGEVLRTVENDGYTDFLVNVLDNKFHFSKTIYVSYSPFSEMTTVSKNDIVEIYGNLFGTIEYSPLAQSAAPLLVAFRLENLSAQSAKSSLKESPSSVASDSTISSSDASSGAQEELLEKIVVSASFDTYIVDGKQKSVVWVKNTSDKVFTGDIFVRVKDENKSTKYQDMIIVENLKPGQQIYANLFIDPVNSPTFEYNFDDDCIFSDLAESVGENDETLSKSIFENFMSSFGATSWGVDITDISIYFDGIDYWAEVSVLKADNAEMIQNATFANIKPNDSNITKVIIKDSDGNQISQKVR